MCCMHKTNRRWTKYEEIAHIALIVMLACVLDTVLGFIINVKMLLPITADMLKNRHFSYVHKCISTANKS